MNSDEEKPINCTRVVALLDDVSSAYEERVATIESELTKDSAEKVTKEVDSTFLCPHAGSARACRL